MTTSNGRETLAANAAAVGKGGFAALAGVAVQKPVLPLAADFRRLILTFHKLNNGTNERGRIAAKRAMSIAQNLPLYRGIEHRLAGGVNLEGRRGASGVVFFLGLADI
jgi:hypothetical protein